MADSGEISVRLLQDISFGDDIDVRLSVCNRIIKCSLCDTAGSRLSDYLEVNGQFSRNFDAAASYGVQILCILSEEDPVNALLRNLNRADIGIQIQFSSQCYVSAFQSASLRRRGRPLQKDITSLDFLQYIIRNSLFLRQTVFNRQTVNLLKDNFAVCDLLFQQVLQDADSLLGNARSDAVSRADSNCNDWQIAEIFLFLCCFFHTHDAAELFCQKGAELSAHIAYHCHLINLF